MPVLTDLNDRWLGCDWVYHWQIPTSLPLPAPAPFNIAEVRYGLTLPPTVGKGTKGPYFGLQVQGDIVPLGYTGMPPITPPDLPAFDGSDSEFYVQLQLSPYSLQSWVWTYQNASTCPSS